DLWQNREPRKRISIESVSLPGHSVPRDGLVSDYLHRHDHAVATEFVCRRDAVVHKFPLSIDGEFERTDQVALIHHLNFIIARVFAEQIHRPEDAFGPVWGFVPRQDAVEGALPTRPNELACRRGGLCRVVLHLRGGTVRLAHLRTVVENLADFLPAVEEMRLGEP